MELNSENGLTIFIEKKGVWNGVFMVDYLKNSNKHFLVKISSYYFAATILLIAGNKTVTELFLLLGEKKFGILSNERIISLLFILLIITSIIVLNKKLIITKRTIIAFYYVLTIFLSLFILSFLNNFGFEKFVHEIFYYYWIVLFFVIYGFKLNFIEEELVKKFFVVYILSQCVLGIAQYVLRKPFVITTYNGEPLLNTIYYLNGQSSANDILYYMGAQVRAFGLTDSGLTLGLFALLLFSCHFYQIFSKNIWRKFTNFLILIVTIISCYMTITRNIYLTAFFMIIILMFLKTINDSKIKLVKFIYITMIILNFLFVTSAERYISFISAKFVSINFSSLFSRAYGYQEVFNRINFDLMHFLFGSGILPSRELYIDNDFLFVFSDVGIYIYIVIQVIYIRILFKGLNGLVNKKYNSYFIKGLIAFLLTYPFASLINAVVYLYFPVAILVYALLLNIDKKNVETN